MYIVSKMIDMGLLENQQWPSQAHKRVAKTIALGNPNVKERDKLTDIVQAVIKVPKDKIKKIDYPTLVNEFNMPNVGIYK